LQRVDGRVKPGHDGKMDEAIVPHGSEGVLTHFFIRSGFCV
jgi:hypothetical protein